MLAIAGGKGGSGKTTTTLGLAAALPGTPTAVDADWDLPNLHALADVDRSPTLASVARGASPVGSLPVATVGPPGDRAHTGTDRTVRIAPAPMEPAAHEPVRTLRTLTGTDSRPVLLDCPAGAGPDAAAPLRVADRTVLVTAPTPAGLRDTVKTAAMARALDARPIGVVLTRSAERPSGVADLLDCPILASVPPVEGDPFRHPPVPSAYEELASGLEGRLNDPDDRSTTPHGCSLDIDG